MTDGCGKEVFVGEKVTVFFSLRDAWLHGYVLSLKNDEALICDIPTFDKCAWATWAKPDQFRRGWLDLPASAP